jgi:thiosulfate dehydrogenase [quinone] large subunit
MGGLSTVTMAVAALAVVLIVVIAQPFVEIDDTIHTYLSYAFWITSIVMVILIYRDSRKGAEADEVEIEGPAVTRFLFSNSRAGLIWLPIRVFLGFAWLDAGWHKFTGEGWVDGGSSLRAYWERAASIPDEGRPPISYDWYRDFIQFLLDNNAEGWMAYVITFGEIAVGLGLLVGALTGIAAFFGATMNMSFLLAGSASTNPVLFTMAIGVILAWKVAGYYGVDRWLLPILGTPWRPGRLAAQSPAPTGSPAG